MNCLVLLQLVMLETNKEEKYMSKRIEIHSIEQAERIVAAIHDDVEQEEVLYKCIDSIFSETFETSGSADSFHNFSVSCAKIAEDYLTAFEVVELGLTLHPSNTDLLADAIKYGYKSGKRQQCENYLKILNGIDKKVWTWRAFSFVIDYMLECYASDNGISNAKKIEDEIELLVKQYQERYPNDEESYFSEFEIYNRLGLKEKAIHVLEKAMLNISVCPKCWLRYADEMIVLGKFESAVEPIMKLCNAATSSDSVNLSYVFYIKGICQIEFLNNVNDNIMDIFAEIHYDLDKVEQIYRSFYHALRSSDIYGSLRNKCLARINELSCKTKTNLPEYLEELMI